ncbi:Glutamate receptor, partial [Stegodyphus mimosarum]
MVTRGEADIIPYLTLTPSRHTVMDYSKPLAAVKYGILVAFPSEPPRAFIFLRPYRKEVWCLCVIAAILMSYMLYLMHKWSCKICKIDKKQTKELASYSRCFWLIYGATLQQGEFI